MRGKVNDQPLGIVGLTHAPGVGTYKNFLSLRQGRSMDNKFTAKNAAILSPSQYF
jgi:hypothetical protein